LPLTFVASDYKGLLERRRTVLQGLEIQESLMDAPCRIELLGWLRVIQGGRVVARFRSTRAGALLAYLAYHRLRSHPREALIELLWPECEPSAGRDRLRVALSSLRRQLEPPGVPAGAVLLATHGVVQLNPDACITDVAELEATLEAAARASRIEERTRWLCRVAEIHRGELLPGYFEPWILAERERLMDACLLEFGRLIDDLERAGELREALHWARRTLRIDPICEEAHEDVIRLLGAMGRPESALRQYRQLERLLEESGADTPPFELWAPTRDREQAARPLPTLAAPEPSFDPRSDGEDAPAEPALAARHLSSLPLQFNRFFGREEELARLSRLLLPGGMIAGEDTPTLGVEGGERERYPEDGRPGSMPGRLVTLTGTGGCGKTRLAVEVGTRLRDTSGIAVWFVPLLNIAAAELIPDQILESLRLPRVPGVAPLEQVVSFLARQRSLLILDNFEHLVESGATVIQTLRERLPSLALLVTSRQCLRLPGEQEFALGPLPVPGVRGEGSGINRDAPESSLSDMELWPLAANPSVALLIDRAHAARPDFQLTPRNAAAVAELVARLEGIPLAIELAAARAGLATPHEMLERLRAPAEPAARFELLTGRGRGGDPRHRSLRAALGWSWQFLSPKLQRVFARLSVFRGGWTAAAAERICEEAGTLEYLGQLSECSLVSAEEMADPLSPAIQLPGSRDGSTARRGDLAAGLPEMRFHMLEMVREYGSEKLDPAERRALHMAHARYFVERARQIYEHLDSLEYGATMKQLWQDRGNLDAALAWSLSEEGAPDLGLELAVLLSVYWKHHHLSALAIRWLETALAQTVGSAPRITRGRALNAAGHHFSLEGKLALARSYLEEAVAACEQNKDKFGLAWSLLNLATVMRETADPAAARSLAEAALAAFEEEADWHGEYHALDFLGSLAQMAGELNLAESYYGRCVAIHRERKSGWGLMGSLSHLGGVARARGELDRARALYQEGLEVAQQVASEDGIAGALGNLGWIALDGGDCQTARSLFTRSLALWQELQLRSAVADSLLDLAWVARCDGEYIEARRCANEALAMARELSQGKLIALARHTLGCVACAEGDGESARALHRESLAIRWQRGDLTGLAASLEAFGGVALVERRWQEAARWLGAADALRTSKGLALLPNERLEHEAALASLRQALGESAFTAAWQEGQRLTCEQAVALAAGEPTSPPTKSVRQMRPDRGTVRPPTPLRSPRGDLTASEWERITPLLPVSTGHRGRPFEDHRLVINGILWVVRTGAAWRDLPARYGSWKTCHDRYRRWRRDGRWDRILAALHPPKETPQPEIETPGGVPR
jgi:predicted ATPase/DNA-binding SARP family transcriptional activator/Tfp pilus assembly protein PilF